MGHAHGRPHAEGLRAKVAQRPDHPNTYQDGMVVHAGGAYAGQLESLIGHGERPCADCGDGRCGDHCVVRPDRFGFYGTRWRAWPGTKVVQTAGVEALTPASPPSMEVPKPAQEALDPAADIDFGVDEPIDGADATTLPGLGPIEPKPKPAPIPSFPPEEPSKPAAPPELPEDTKPARKTEPSEKEPEEEPAPETPSSDDNLFDEASRGLRLNERLALLHARAKPRDPEPIRFPGAATAKPLVPPTDRPPRLVDRVEPTAGGVAPAVASPATPRPNPLRR